jgi:hypothetical protein
MIRNKLTKEAYKREINKICCSRQASSIRKNNPETKVLRQAVGEIQRILPHCTNFLFPGRFGIEICVVGYLRGDVDNVGKGILDALQSTAYGNDRDCDDFRSYRDHNYSRKKQKDIK